MPTSFYKLGKFTLDTIIMCSYFFQTCRHNYDNVICQTPNLNTTKTIPKESLQIKAVFDSIEVTLGSLSVQPDPVFNVMGNIRFQYPFEDTITLDVSLSH